MIRPFTCVCMVMALGSGLYLYSAKHRVQLLDRDITETVRLTQSAQTRSGVLRAEWTLLNDPERLQQLSDRFLSLKTVAPGQFTTLAELDKRLPPVRVPEPPKPAGTTDEDVPVAARTPSPVAEPEAPKVASLPDAKPDKPEKPEPPKAVAAAAKPAPVKVAAARNAAERATERAAEQQRERLAERRAAQSVATMETRSYVTPVAARVPAPVPIARPYVPSALPQPVAAPAPAVTSVLGMTRTTLAPPVPFAPPVGNGGG